MKGLSVGGFETRPYDGRIPTPDICPVFLYIFTMARISLI